MPSFDGLDPLGPDACRSDPSAPCRYWHLKLHALNGGFDKLSDQERVFVGVGVPGGRPPDLAGGWRSPIAIVIDQLGGRIPPEDLRMLERMAGMDTPPQERLGFLG